MIDNTAEFFVRSLAKLVMAEGKLCLLMIMRSVFHGGALSR